MFNKKIQVIKKEPNGNNKSQKWGNRNEEGRTITGRRRQEEDRSMEQHHQSQGKENGKKIEMYRTLEPVKSNKRFVQLDSQKQFRFPETPKKAVEQENRTPNKTLLSNAGCFSRMLKKVRRKGRETDNLIKSINNFDIKAS